MTWGMKFRSVFLRYLQSYIFFVLAMVQWQMFEVRYKCSFVVVLTRSFFLCFIM